VSRIIFISLCNLCCLIFSTQASAFACSVNGQGVGSYQNSVTYIDVDVVYQKEGGVVSLGNVMATGVCGGQVGYNDALRLNVITIGAAFSSVGYSGRVNGLPFSNINHNYCIWPNATCADISLPNSNTIPIRALNIGLDKALTVSGEQQRVMPRGAEIATLRAAQRGARESGFNYPFTWVLRLKNDLIIPAYTCKIEDSSRYQAVYFDDVTIRELHDNGVGFINKKIKSFNIDLECEPGTSVYVSFGGAVMDGYEQVLANTTVSDLGSSNIGVQLRYNDVPITLGESMFISSNASEKESLAFTASYYYNGGPIYSGEVNSTATLEILYN
jgi:type 1 fimbria pilin